MAALTLDVRLDGFAEPVGTFTRDERQALAFAYRAAHLTDPNALPLSLSLPLTDEPYGDVTTRAFFGNLLQENTVALSALLEREGLARDDVAGLLLHVGKDCAGALSVLPQGAPPVKVPGDLATDYNPLSDDALSAIVVALRDRSRLPKGAADPSPLAGVQSKIALTLLSDGRLAEPVPGSGAPTTHILKVPDRDHPRDAVYEAVTLQLSRTLGIESAEAASIEIGGIQALLVRRFDRALDVQGRIVRVHQEDFAQALGLPAALKYERHGAPERRFDVVGVQRVLDATVDPVAARDVMIRATLFDLMTGNADFHAKNHAILHLGRNVIQLAPRYDLLPTRLDPNLTDELAFRIGSATTLADITRQDFETFLEKLGIATPAGRLRITTGYVRVLADGLGGTFAELTSNGMKAFADLIAANLRQLLPALGLPVPRAAQERDAFVVRGGGWLNS